MAKESGIAKAAGNEFRGFVGNSPTDYRKQCHDHLPRDMHLAPKRQDLVLSRCFAQDHAAPRETDACRALHEYVVSRMTNMTKRHDPNLQH